ncbi:MAG: hypothetical protein V2J25_16840 [Desulfatiglans sp.]|jgi:hypothetical protein|nr:hypothetical protein [Thermodesulfobacteriota bacterium]MEE4354528.1 hypothetical protein [Desulfatiglans sp.]
MKILHIMKTAPDTNTQMLIDIISRDSTSTLFTLYNDEADYDKLIDLIFENDQVVSW